MLTLDIYILQQTVLTVPQQPVRPLDSSKSLAAYAACPWTRTGTAACAAFGRACPTAAYAVSGRVCPTAAFAASGLTRTCSKADFAACLCLYSRLRPLDSSVLCNRICCLWTCVSYLIDCAASGCLFHNSLESLFGLFRFVSKQLCLFRLFRYRFETPKQTEILCFWFHETNRNKRETDHVSVFFGSNRNFFFISRTP